MTIREAARAEIEIRTPETSRSGKWELSTGERDSTVYDNFWTMVDFLANKYDVEIDEVPPTVAAVDRYVEYGVEVER